MTHSSWAYLSNYLVYSAMGVYTLAFFAHAYETAWAVRAPQGEQVQAEGSLLVKTLDYQRTERAGRIATAFMILGFLHEIFSLKRARATMFSTSTPAVINSTPAQARSCQSLNGLMAKRNIVIGRLAMGSVSAVLQN